MKKLKGSKIIELALCEKKNVGGANCRCKCDSGANSYCAGPQVLAVEACVKFCNRQYSKVRSCVDGTIFFADVGQYSPIDSGN